MAGGVLDGLVTSCLLLLTGCLLLLLLLLQAIPNEGYGKAIGMTEAPAAPGGAATKQVLRQLAEQYTQGITLPLTPAERMARQYRMYKKMIMWDHVIMTGAPLGDLE